MAEPYDGILEGVEDLGWPMLLMIVVYAAAAVVVTAPVRLIIGSHRRLSSCLRRSPRAS